MRGVCSARKIKHRESLGYVGRGRDDDILIVGPVFDRGCPIRVYNRVRIYGKRREIPDCSFNGIGIYDVMEGGTFNSGTVIVR